MRVLALNVGSSSVKFAFYDDEREVTRGEGAVADVLRDVPRPDAIGHRIVHGGTHTAHAVLDAALLKILEDAVPFAPLHLPIELDAIRACERFGVPQVACFDTHFHARLPEVAWRLPIPDEPGLRKYGFHGLSYEYICSQRALPRRAVIAHLGSGASLVALADGAPIDTTMGFTPCGGIVMGTRPGDLDPGVLVYLHGRGHGALETMINKESGLRALSGGTSDMRALLAARGSDARAALAVDAFCKSVQKAIGAYAALLGGLDLLIFTGGIGAHADALRDEITAPLAFLGAEIAAMPTNEELVVARHTRRLL